MNRMVKRWSHDEESEEDSVLSVVTKTATLTFRRTTITTLYGEYTLVPANDHSGSGKNPSDVRPAPSSSQSFEPPIVTPAVLLNPAPVLHDQAEVGQLSGIVASISSDILQAQQAGYTSNLGVLQGWYNAIKQSKEAVEAFLARPPPEPSTLSRPDRPVPPSTSTNLVFMTSFTTSTASLDAISSAQPSMKSSLFGSDSDVGDISSEEIPDPVNGVSSSDSLSRPSLTNFASFSLSDTPRASSTQKSAEAIVEDGLSKTALIAIIGSAGGAALLLIAIIWYCCRRGRATKHDADHADYYDSTHDEWKGYTDTHPVLEDVDQHTGYTHEIDDSRYSNDLTSYASHSRSHTGARSSFAQQTRGHGLPMPPTTVHSPSHAPYPQSAFNNAPSQYSASAAPQSTYAQTQSQTQGAPSTFVQSRANEPVSFRPARAPPSTKNAASHYVRSDHGDVLSRGGGSASTVAT